MKILFTGKGTSGSWQIRGVQLGNAMRATVLPNANAAAMRRHDVVLLVKRPTPQLLEAIREAGTPVAWDVVDAYPQPESIQWGRTEAVNWLQATIKAIRPRGLVCATERMRIDADFAESIALPHHARPGQRINPIREKVRAIGYEGREEYLAGWRPLLEQECANRGWKFVVNPLELADLDIVVALRGGIWRGYVTDNWKSGVKLANAQSTGTPAILTPECGYTETASGAEYWATNSQQLTMALDWLTPYQNRLDVSRRILARAPGLADVAQRYREWLERLA